MRRRILLLVVGMTTLVVLAFAIPLVIVLRHNAFDDGKTSLGADQTGIAGYLRGSNTPRTSAGITAVLKRATTAERASVELPGGKVLGSPPPGKLADLPPVKRQGFGAPFPSSGAQPSSTAPTCADIQLDRGGTRGAFPGGGNATGNGGSGGGGAPGGFGRDLETQGWSGGQLIQMCVAVPHDASDTSQTLQFYTVRVWASDGKLYSGANGSLLLLGGVAIALLNIGVVLGELLTRRIVRPLVNTADTAQKLAGGDVTARATTSGPVEVADVGRALNRLADRIDELIAEERETVADLSHRLRTPLTALRLDAEALRDPAAAEVVGGHVTTLERMLTAVIHAARRPQREGRMPSSDATEVVGERVSFWSALAEDQERAATISLPSAPLPVRAGAEDLAAAVDALMENVIAHTPEGTAYSVTLAATDSGARLVISDDGPGLPPEAAVRGRSDRGSSGLGLDIARRAAEASGGAMTLGSSPSGGALVTLDLGTP